MRRELYTDFSRGELSPLMQGRPDIQIYNQGFSWGDNMVPLVPTGITRRPGTWYREDATADITDDPDVVTDEIRLIPWETKGAVLALFGGNKGKILKNSTKAYEKSSAIEILEDYRIDVTPSAATPDVGAFGEYDNISVHVERTIVTPGDASINLAVYLKDPFGLTITDFWQKYNVYSIYASCTSTGAGANPPDVEKLLATWTTGVQSFQFNGLTNGEPYEIKLFVKLNDGPPEEDRVFFLPTDIIAPDTLSWEEIGGDIVITNERFPMRITLGDEDKEDVGSVVCTEYDFTVKDFQQYEMCYVGEVRRVEQQSGNAKYRYVYYECIKDLAGTALTTNDPSTEPTYWRAGTPTTYDMNIPFQVIPMFEKYAEILKDPVLSTNGGMAADGMGRIIYKLPNSEDYPEYIDGILAGYGPAEITAHQGRLVFASSDEEPATVWGSSAVDYKRFAIEIDAGDPWSYDLPTESDRITWMTSTDTGIVMGSRLAEYKLSGGDLGITPTSVFVQKLSTFGSSGPEGVLYGSQILFMDKSKARLRNYFYDDRRAAFQSANLSEQAEHILDDDYYEVNGATSYGGKGVYDIARQDGIATIFWMIKNSGQLIGLTYSGNTLAWHKHKTKNGTFHSICSYKGDEEDTVYFVVKREIDGNTKYYIETMDPIEIHQDTDDIHFVDCGAEGLPGGSPLLTHLENEEVCISIGPKSAPKQTVTGGVIDVLKDFPGSNYTNSAYYWMQSAKSHAGLEIETRIRTMRKMSPMSTQAIGRIMVRLYRSTGGYITEGIAPGEPQGIPYETVSNNNSISAPYTVVDLEADPKAYASFIELFTGDLYIDFLGDWTTEGYLWIIQDEPLPLNVTGMYIEVEDGS